jgi:hypothetical protein
MNMLLNLILLRSDPGAYLIVGLIVLVISAITYFFSRKAVVRRRLREADVKRIMDFADGDTARVIGKIVFAGETIKAPLSKRQCSYYHVVVEEYRSSGKSGHWHTLVDEEKKATLLFQMELAMQLLIRETR